MTHYFHHHTIHTASVSTSKPVAAKPPTYADAAQKVFEFEKNTLNTLNPSSPEYKSKVALYKAQWQQEYANNNSYPPQSGYASRATIDAPYLEYFNQEARAANDQNNTPAEFLEHYAGLDRHTQPHV